MDNNLDLFLLNIDTKPDRKALPQPKNITADNPANDFAPDLFTEGGQDRVLPANYKVLLRRPCSHHGSRSRGA